MTTHPKKILQPRQPLKVVPPSLQDSSIHQPVQSSDSIPSSKSLLSNPSLTWGMIIFGLIGIGMIPVNPRLNGKTTITSTVEKRQSVTMPQMGILSLRVRSNQIVKPGDILATISSPELDQKIADTQEALAENKASITINQQKLFLAQSQLEIAKTSQMIAEQKFQRKREELNKATTENQLPKIRGIQNEQEGIQNEILGIRNQISGLENEISGINSEIKTIERSIESLKKQLDMAETAMKQQKLAVQEGALSKLSLVDDDQKIEALKGEINQQQQQIVTRQQQINQKQNQIRQTEQLIAQKNQTIELKSEQINEVTDFLEQELDETQYQVQQKLAERVSAQKEVDAALAELVAQQKLLTQKESEFNRLQQQKQQLIIKSNITGTVITPDLDLVTNQTLEVGREILNIVNLSTLTGLVEIRQEDIDLINPTSPVIFKPRQATPHQYQAKIQNIPPVIKSDESNQKSVLQVKISIDNADQKLQPGLVGEAHFETHNMRVYEVIQREVLKLFPWWKI